MKSATSQERAKHPAKRGDVLIGSGSRQNSRFGHKLERKLSVRLSLEELESLEVRAAAAGLGISAYARECLVNGRVSRETGFVLAELGRVRELLTRFQAISAAGRPTQAQISDAIDHVEALDPRVLIARAMGAK